MRKLPLIALSLLLVAAAWTALPPQRTPAPSVATYDALADAILAMDRAEEGFVKAMLDSHLRAAERRMERADYSGAAAEMALFANEGDNAVAGIRKRLVDGGHHHHADAEAQGLYEEGFVVVTRKAKRVMLEASAAMRDAGDEAAATAAWEGFMGAAGPLLEAE